MVMVLRSESPDFVAGGAKCLDFPPTRERDEWFGDATDHSKRLYGPALEEDARRICNGDDDGIVCPMREDCLFFALLNNEHYGVWGGLSVEQRHHIRRNNPRDNWQWALAPALREDGELDLAEDGTPNRRVGSPTTQPPRRYPAFYSEKSKPTS